MTNRSEHSLWESRPGDLLWTLTELLDAARWGYFWFGAFVASLLVGRFM